MIRTKARVGLVLILFLIMPLFARSAEYTFKFSPISVGFNTFYVRTFLSGYLLCGPDRYCITIYTSSDQQFVLRYSDEAARDRLINRLRSSEVESITANEMSHARLSNVIESDQISVIYRQKPLTSELTDDLGAWIGRKLYDAFH